VYDVDREAAGRLARLRDSPVAHRQRSTLGDLALFVEPHERRIQRACRRASRVEAARELGARSLGIAEVQATCCFEQRSESLDHVRRLADP
jgi:hypothetical protein